MLPLHDMSTEPINVVAQPATPTIPEDRHWWFASRTRAIRSVLDPVLPPRKNARRRILDVGCGAGNMMHHLAQYGTVTGVDNFEKPLEICRQRGYDCRLAPAEQLPFQDNTFDLVALLDVIEHCGDDIAVLKESRRVCREGGRILITTPAFPSLWTSNDDLNGHKRRYMPDELKQKLATAGLTVERFTFNNFFVFPLAAGLLSLRRIRGEKLKIATPRTDDDAYQVEMEPASPLVNTVLTGVGLVEANLIRLVPLPIGTSLVCLARKNRT